MKNSCLASLVAFIFAFFLIIFIVATQIKSLTNVNFWTNALDKQQLLTQLSNSIDSMALSQREAGGENINTTALTKVIFKTIDPALFAQEFDTALGAFFGYAKGETETLDATVSLVAWKAKFQSDWPVLAPAIFRAEYDKLPACKENEKADKIVDGQTVINCQSAALPAEAIEKSAKEADLKPFLTAVPDNFSLSDLAKKNQIVFDKIRMGFNILNLIFWASLVITLLSVAGLVAIGWPNWRAISGWIGWVMLIAIAPFALFQFMSQKILSVMESLIISRIDQNISQIVSTTVASLNQNMLRSSIGLTATITSISIILIVLSFVLPKYEPKITPPGFGPEK